MTPDPKRPLKVFLCHAHADRDPVRGLYTRLTQDGVDAWFDKAKLLPGQDWELEIRKAVREADVVVVCLSKQFNQAGFRQKEVRLALDTAMEKPEGEIFIIPARLQECDTLESLRKWHWVDLFEDDGYEMLMRALRARADSIGVTLQAKKRDLPKATPSRSEGKKTSKNSSIGTPISNLSPEGSIGSKQADLTSQDFSSIRINSNSVIQSGDLRKGIKEGSRQPSSRKRAATTSEGKKQNKVVEVSKKRLKLRTEYVIAIIGAVATLVAGILSSPLIERWLDSVSTPTATSFATLLPPTTPATFKSLTPTKNTTPIFTITATPTFTPTLTPTPTNTSTATPVVLLDGNISMVLIPAGSSSLYTNQKMNSIYVNSFYIDQHEVTNTQYEECVATGACVPPFTNADAKYVNVVHYGDHSYGKFPVVLVNWGMAESYCRWRGENTRLPTVNEWEKAARGLLVNQSYPWGEELPACDQESLNGANFFQCGTNDAIPVMQFMPNGYGLYDVSGNVGEWVSAISVLGVEHFIRGGSWLSSSSQIKVISESRGIPSQGYVDTGFRCVREVNP